MLRLPEAQKNQRQSVENWVLGNKPLVRSESTCFLDNAMTKDRVVLGRDQSDQSGLETLLESALRAFPGTSSQVSVPLLRNWTEGNEAYSSRSARYGPDPFPNANCNIPNSSVQSITHDSHIFVLPPGLLSRIVKTFMAFFFPLWLIFPAVLLYGSSSHSGRAIIYAVSTFCTSFIVISTTNTTKYDLILALIT